MIKTYDSILLEFEELSGSKAYSNNLDELNYELKNNNRLLALINGYYLLKLDVKCGITDLEYWGIYVKGNSLDDLKKVEQAIKALKTTIRINAIRNKKGKKEDKINFDRLLIRVENSLERNLIKDDLTVSRWIEVIKSISEKQKEIKNIKDGRNN